jgi:hypothetical protein
MRGECGACPPRISEGLLHGRWVGFYHRLLDYWINYTKTKGQMQVFSLRGVPPKCYICLCPLSLSSVFFLVFNPVIQQSVVNKCQTPKLTGKELLHQAI